MTPLHITEKQLKNLSHVPLFLWVALSRNEGRCRAAAVWVLLALLEGVACDAGNGSQ